MLVLQSWTMQCTAMLKSCSDTGIGFQIETEVQTAKLQSFLKEGVNSHINSHSEYSLC